MTQGSYCEWFIYCFVGGLNDLFPNVCNCLTEYFYRAYKIIGMSSKCCCLVIDFVIYAANEKIRLIF